MIHFIIVLLFPVLRHRSSDLRFLSVFVFPPSLTLLVLILCLLSFSTPPILHASGWLLSASLSPPPVFPLS